MARQAARLADLILIPCRPKAFDLAAIEATAELVKASDKPAFVVLMAGPPKAPLIYKEAAEVIEGSFGLQLAPVMLPERAAFHHSTAQGRTAEDFDRGGKAAAEIRALWSWTRGQLSMSACEPVHTLAPAR